MSSLLSVIDNIPSASEIRKPSKSLTVIIVLGCPPFKTPANSDISLTHRGIEHFFLYNFRYLCLPEVAILNLSFMFSLLP